MLLVQKFLNFPILLWSMDSHYLILGHCHVSKLSFASYCMATKHQYMFHFYFTVKVKWPNGLTCLPKLLFIFPKTEITTNDIGNEKGDYAFIYMYISNMYTILLYSRVHSVAQIFYLQVIISILI